jgi:hypothetical protein
MKRIGMLAVVVVLTLAALTLSGCQQMAKDALQNATGVSVDQSGVTVPTPSGGQATIGSSKGQVPEGFPAEFPIPEGSTVTRGSKVSVGSGTLYQVSLDVPSEPLALLETYSVKLKAAGYDIVSQNKVDAGSMKGGVITARKGTAGEATVTVRQSGTGSKVTLSVTVAAGQ